jgi:choline dehydrogenase-like flavoprotein
MPICPAQAKYTALRTIKQLSDRKTVEIRTQSVASKLILDKDSGRISGVEYKQYGEPGSVSYKTEQVSGTLVVLAANAIENATLLLASNVANKSKQVGKNLMDHPYLYAWGLAGKRVFPFRGPDTTSGMESLRDGQFRKVHASFRASLSNWGWSGEPKNQISGMLSQGIYGTALRQQLADTMTRMVKIGFMFEQLPSSKNLVGIDPTMKDGIGNFRPVFKYDYDDYTLKGIEEAIHNVWSTISGYAGIVDKTSYPVGVGGGTQSVMYNKRNYNIMGSGHIVGTHCMGSDRKKSVTDDTMRSWDHDNLYVVGAGSQVTIGTANPTLTAAALSVRAAEAMLKQLK